MLITTNKVVSYEISSDTHITFPFKEFFNFSGQNLDETIMSYLCVPAVTRCCQCTQDCVKKRSCCIDSAWNHYNGSLSTYLEWFIERARPYTKFECTPLLSGAKFMDSSHYMMIVSCLKEYKEPRCQNQDLLLPVLASNGYMYKNEFCAQCNNQTAYEFLGLKMTCNTTKDKFKQQKTSFDKENCTIRPDQKTQKLLWKNRIFSCLYPTNHVKDCHPSSPHYKLCNAYLAYSDGFANPHCLKCANNSAKIGNLEECIKPEKGVRPGMPLLPETLFSYAMVISFDTADCSPGRIWDIVKMHCVSFRCSQRLKGKSSTCGTVPTTMSSSIRTAEKVRGKVKNSGEYITNHTSSNNSKNDYNELFTKCLHQGSDVGLIATCPQYQDPDAQRSNGRLKHCLKGDYTDFYQMKGNESIYVYAGGSSLMFIENIVDPCFRKQWLDNFNCKYIQVTSVKKQSYNLLSDHDLQRNFPHGDICNNYTKIAVHFVQLYENCSMSWKNQTYKYGEYVMIKRFTRKKEALKHVVICNQFQPRSNCFMKDLRVGPDYYIDQRRHIIPKEQTDLPYAPVTYIPFKGTMQGCTETETSRKAFKNAQNDLSKYYITVFGLPLSIAGHLVVVIVYSTLKELDNKTGFGLIWLCISLAASDMIMFVLAMGYIDETMHESIAIALHWCFLNALSWITVLSLGLLGMLTNEYTIVQQNTLKKNIRSWIFATCFPSLAIAVLVYANHYHPSWVGYGRALTKNLMVNQVAVYITVLAPFVATNAVSLVIFLAIISKLHLHCRSLQQSGISSSICQTNINVAKTAMKLVALLGVAELLGLVQTKQPAIDEVFSTLYVFFRSSRGIFISVLYVFNCSTRRLLKRKIQRFTSSISQESALEIS